MNVRIYRKIAFAEHNLLFTAFEIMQRFDNLSHFSFFRISDVAVGVKVSL